MQKILSQGNNCPQKNNTECECYGGVQTVIGITENNLVEVNFTTEHLMEYIFSPGNLNKSYLHVKRNAGASGVDKMGIAASAYLLMALVSLVVGLPLFSTIDPEVGGSGVSLIKVGPWLLIVTYFILTVAELYISPLGISFVSKVAPPKYQGIMQGGWLGATAVGNQLLIIGAILYENIPIWLTWTVFVVVCCMSMITMLIMLKWLEKIAK